MAVVGTSRSSSALGFLRKRKRLNDLAMHIPAHLYLENRSREQKLLIYRPFLSCCSVQASQLQA